MKALSATILVVMAIVLSHMAMAACGGTLTGSVVTYTSTQSINLTTLGTTDWAAFGYNTNAASIQRKTTGGSQISTLTQVGTATLGQSNHSIYPPVFQSTWTDGTPTASVSNESYVVNSVSSAGHAAGTGMSFTVPADTTLRTLTVYVGIAYNAALVQGKLTATLTDGSAVPYVDTTITNNPGSQIVIGAYTINYAAGKPGEMLTVQWVNNNVPTYAQNVFIFAATLQVPGSGAAMKAFPGAEGFGAVTRGAAGGTNPSVIHVKNTNDSGADSFRAALTASGPRYVVFDTGGRIDLASAIVVSNPYLTIACQTAPGGGIQFTGWGVRFVNTHDIIVRYCKSRSGYQVSPNDWTTDHVGFDVSGSGGTTSETVAPMSNIIIDHTDMEFSPRDNMDTWDNVHNLTVQRSIMADSIQSSNSGYGFRAYSLSGTADSGLEAYNTTGVSVHHNLMAHNNQRSPDIRTVGLVELVNNVIYDYGSFATEVDNARANDATMFTSFPNQTNVIGNYYLPGTLSTYTSRYEVTLGTSQNAGLWVYDNISPHRTSATPTTLASNWTIVGDVEDVNGTSPCYACVNPPASEQAITPFAMSSYPITTQNHSVSTSTVLNNVLADVGANKNVTSTSRPHINTSIDTLTARMISETQNANGSAAPSTFPADGGVPGSFVTYPTLATGTMPTDTDCDGIPDDVETAAGLSTTNGSCTTGLGGDSLKTNPATGYTYLEDYINGVIN